VEMHGESPKGSGGPSNGHTWSMNGNGGNVTPPSGRFPANLVLDGSDEVVSLFPNKTQNGSHIEGERGYNDSASRYFKTCPFEQDDFEAYRIFYGTKPSKKERNAGCENIENEKFTAGNYSQSPVCKDCNKTLNGTNDHSKCSGEVYYKEMKSKKTRNNHPTVKALSLMRYLCRLITFPGGTVLDPFMGSGSTGVAAIQEGFNFIGIDAEPEYIKIAKARIEYYYNEKMKELNNEPNN